MGHRAFVPVSIKHTRLSTCIDSKKKNTEDVSYSGELLVELSEAPPPVAPRVPDAPGEQVDGLDP
jgi:hypothetical protein